MQSRAGERAVSSVRLLLQARYFDYQRKTNVAVIELEHLARLGIISVCFAFLGRAFSRFSGYLFEVILQGKEDRECLLRKKIFFEK